MSSEPPILRAEGVSKSFQLGGPDRPTTNFREALTDAILAPLRRLRTRRVADAGQQLWALKDVSFQMARGEILGLIGRNGAGKSTLLRILCRITEPTAGRIEIRGRVGSLLEVGTGFHPELTGRENVYLNGTILGMKRREIERKFDAIVGFAEIERFIDTPVKRYSSGMYVRLAFAVAAHLEPEILLVDEVLAVGDAAFQKKCLGKMSDVARTGRTIVFVSHNMAAVRGLCDRAMLIDGGRVLMNDAVEPVVRRYLADVEKRAGDDRSGWIYRHSGSRIEIKSVDLIVDGMRCRAVQAGDRCVFRVSYRLCKPEALGTELSLSLLLFSEGQKVANLWTNYRQGRGVPLAADGVVDCTVSKWPFRSAKMRLDIFAHVGAETETWIEECLSFNSYDGDFYDSGIITNADQGIVFLEHEWSVHPDGIKASKG